jgi:hypothetical protein
MECTVTPGARRAQWATYTYMAIMSRANFVDGTSKPLQVPVLITQSMLQKSRHNPPVYLDINASQLKFNFMSSKNIDPPVHRRTHDPIRCWSIGGPRARLRCLLIPKREKGLRCLLLQSSGGPSLHVPPGVQDRCPRNLPARHGGLRSYARPACGSALPGRCTPPRLRVASWAPAQHLLYVFFLFLRFLSVVSFFF